MSNREISLWVDERWYAAINRQMKDETLEEHLETVIDELCDQLPEHVYERISAEIWEEQQARLEQNRKFSPAAGRSVLMTFPSAKTLCKKRIVWSSIWMSPLPQRTCSAFLPTPTIAMTG